MPDWIIKYNEIYIHRLPYGGISWEPLRELFEYDNRFVNQLNEFSKAVTYGVNKLMKEKINYPNSSSSKNKFFNLHIVIGKYGFISVFKDNNENIDELLTAIHEGTVLYLSILYAIRKCGGEEYYIPFTYSENEFFGCIAQPFQNSMKDFIEEINNFSNIEKI